MTDLLNETKEAIRKAQWSGGGIEEGWCPFCEATTYESLVAADETSDVNHKLCGHKPECIVVKLEVAELL